MFALIYVWYTIKVYDTYMLNEESFVVLDDALIRLRRLWAMPVTQGPASGDRDAIVAMSTVLVVDAIHRLQALQPDAEVSLAAIADRLDVAPSTSSRLVDRAATAGMVTRRTSEVDPRRAALTLTVRGQALLAESGAFRRSLLNRLLAGWTASETVTFAALLDRFATALHQQRPTPATSKETTR